MSEISSQVRTTPRNEFSAFDEEFSDSPHYSKLVDLMTKKVLEEQTKKVSSLFGIDIVNTASSGTSVAVSNRHAGKTLSKALLDNLQKEMWQSVGIPETVWKVATSTSTGSAAAARIDQETFQRSYHGGWNYGMQTSTPSVAGLLVNPIDVIAYGTGHVATTPVIASQPELVVDRTVLTKDERAIEL